MPANVPAQRMSTSLWAITTVNRFDNVPNAHLYMLKFKVIIIIPQDSRKGNKNT